MNMQDNNSIAQSRRNGTQSRMSSSAAAPATKPAARNLRLTFVALASIVAAFAAIGGAAAWIFLQKPNQSQSPIAATQASPPATSAQQAPPPAAPNPEELRAALSQHVPTTFSLAAVTIRSIDRQPDGSTIVRATATMIPNTSLYAVADSPIRPESLSEDLQQLGLSRTDAQWAAGRAGKIILTPDLAPGRRYDLANAVVAAQSGRPIQTPCVARASRETSGRWIITPAEGGVDPLKEIVRNGSEASSAATAQPAATKPAASLLALPPQSSQSDSQAPDVDSTTPDPPKTLLRTATDMATIQGEQARRLSTLGDRIKRADQKAEAAYRDALPSATGKKPKFLGAGTGGPTTAAEGAAIGAAAGLLGGGLGGGATGMAIGGPLGLIGGGLGGAFYSHSKEEKKWREKQAAHASAVRHAQQLRSRIRKEELEKLDAQLDQEALTRHNLLRPTAATPSQPADPTPSQMPAAPWDN